MNRNLGRLPDLPGFPGNAIRSSASASDTFQRSINDQKVAGNDQKVAGKDRRGGIRGIVS
jgi:hypothetical protein